MATKSRREKQRARAKSGAVGVTSLRRLPESTFAPDLTILSKKNGGESAYRAAQTFVELRPGLVIRAE